MFPPIDLLTKDGYDLQFGTNVIGHFLFTRELIPLLEAAAQTSPDKTARIVNTSSAASLLYTLNFETFKDSPSRKKLSNQTLYSQSKFVRFLLVVFESNFESESSRQMW